MRLRGESQLTGARGSDYDCSMLRNILCWMLVVLTPAWVVAADASAMLYGKGVVLRNGVAIPNSSAMFSGDVIETRPDSIASLNSLGSSVVILPTSLVEFDGQSVSVEHGSVRVATSHGISVRVRCMTVVPVTSAWTQFEVTDVNGSVEVAATKNDVRLETAASSSSQTEIASSQTSSDLREGEQATRDESDGCKSDKRKRDAGAAPAGSGGVFGSDYVKYGALAAIGGVGVWLALDDDDPPSPWKP